MSSELENHGTPPTDLGVHGARHAVGSQRPAHLLALLLVALVTLAVFGRASGFDFLLWDDDIQLSNNPTVRTLDWVTAWRMFTQGYAIRYQPLAWLSSAVLARAGGIDSFPFHSFNIVLHAISAVLAAVLVRRLLTSAGYGPTSGIDKTILAPAFAALVFALHPLRAEPIAWAIGWRYCQSVVLMLASALLYLRAIEAHPKAGMRTASYWLSVFAFVLSALTYPFCLEWPLVLVVLDAYPLRRWHTRAAWLEKVPFALVALGALAASVAVRLSTHVAGFEPVSLGDYGVAVRLMKALQVWADATWRGLLPVDLRPVYVACTPFHPLSARPILSAVAMVGITLLLVWRRRTHPALLALWVVHFVLLGAKLGLLETGHVEAADRFTYPAGLAWAGLAACGFIAAARWPLGRTFRVPVATLLLALFAFSTFRYLGIWRNDVIFFRAGLASVGDSFLRDEMLWRLALAHWRRDEPQLALPLFDEAVARRPADLRVRLMRAGLLKRLGKEQDAIRETAEAIRLAGTGTPEEIARRISEFVQLR